MPELTNPVLDTLELARMLYPSMKNHRLNTLAEKFKVSLENHHRAIDDTVALGGILFGLLKECEAAQASRGLQQLNDYVGKDLSNARPFHCCIYALNATGQEESVQADLAVAYRIFQPGCRAFRKVKLNELREGLLIMSGCEKGEFFETVLNKIAGRSRGSRGVLRCAGNSADRFYMHLVDKGLVGSRAEVEEAIRTVCRDRREAGQAGHRDGQCPLSASAGQNVPRHYDSRHHGLQSAERYAQAGCAFPHDGGNAGGIRISRRSRKRMRSS